jgi:hypothetical protein
MPRVRAQVTQRGWAPAALAQWLSDSLAATLLPPG